VYRSALEASPCGTNKPGAGRPARPAENRALSRCQSHERGRAGVTAPAAGGAYPRPNLM